MGAFRVPPALVRLGARQISHRALNNPRLPWEAQRRRLSWLVRSWPLPQGTSVTDTALNGIPAEVVTARGGTAAVTVVHFHGGGYCVGLPAEARNWAAHLSARAGCRVILPGYRLAPEHAYPAALEDARAVMAEVLA
ncbi:MAG: alpha/beta hydrolase fold domain-containing protein, partial [Trebonia sp.]